jgi:hypothetical protein
LQYVLNPELIARKIGVLQAPRVPTKTVKFDAK